MLGGVGDPGNCGDGVTVALPGDGDGETVRLAAGEGLALPVRGVGVSAAGGFVPDGVPDGSGLGSVGVSDSRPTDGDGSGTGVPEGVGGEGVASTCAKASEPNKPSAEESGAKKRNNKSPASNKAPAGLNKGTLTLSS